LIADRAEWATKAAQAELALENARSELNSVRQRADALQAEWGQKCNQVDELLAQIEAARSELRAAEQRERRAQITVTQLSWAREELDGVTRELGETAAALSHASFKLENERSARAVQQTTLSALEAELEAARSALAEEADNLSKSRSELSQSRGPSAIKH
jgi:chromosome segregation ATPase